MTEVKSHNDIYKRIEKVEIDVAVLDSKTNRLHVDLDELKIDIKDTGRVARRIQTLVVVIPGLIGAMWMLLSIFQTVSN